VGDESSRWNTLLPSLIDLAEKLERLGLTYSNSLVTHIERVEVSHV